MLAFGEAGDRFAKDLPDGGLGPGSPALAAAALMALRHQPATGAAK